MKNKEIRNLVVTLSLIVVLITGCDPSKKWARQEADSIQFYLGSIGDTVYVKKPSGLYYLDLVVGSGVTPVNTDTAYIKFKGMTLAGQVFGNNFTDTTNFAFIVGAGGVIAGLDEGVRYMKVGGTSKMLIPSALGYGDYGYYGIPGYAPLLFTVQLVQVKGPAGK